MDYFKSLQYIPMMASAGEPFDRKDFLFEVKWDGYRALAYLGTNTSLQSRNLKDLTFYFPNLRDLHKKVKVTPVIIDGEIIALENGKPSFQKLQGNKQDAVIFVAFDILYLQDKSVIDLPLLERKRLLQEIVKEDSNLLLSQFILEEGKKFFKSCAENGLEGIVAKQVDSIYLPGKRVKFWQKIKATKEEDYIIVGFLPGKASVIGSLALATYQEEKLVYKGLVGTGLKEDLKVQLMELFEELKFEQYPFDTQFAELKGCRFLIPHLVCSVTYLEETSDGRLRHPSFKGLRFDKFARDFQ